MTRMGFMNIFDQDCLGLTDQVLTDLNKIEYLTRMEWVNL